MGVGGVSSGERFRYRGDGMVIDWIDMEHGKDKCMIGYGGINGKMNLVDGSMGFSIRTVCPSPNKPCAAAAARRRGCLADILSVGRSVWQLRELEVGLQS